MQNEVQSIYQKSITPEDVNKLPTKYFEGEIFIVDSDEKLQFAVNQLQNSLVIGFDTETKPNFKKGNERHQVALLQLASANETFLFRLNKNKLPDAIISILTNQKLIKVGVAIREDIRILQKIASFKPESFIELQDYVKEFQIENFSLKNLAALVLNIRISKSQRLSDWEAEELSSAQMIYAATDAWACKEIYLKLKNGQ